MCVSDATASSDQLAVDHHQQGSPGRRVPSDCFEAGAAVLDDDAALASGAKRGRDRDDRRAPSFRWSELVAHRRSLDLVDGTSLPGHPGTVNRRRAVDAAQANSSPGPTPHSTEADGSSANTGRWTEAVWLRSAGTQGSLEIVDGRLLLCHQRAQLIHPMLSVGGQGTSWPDSR